MSEGWEKIGNEKKMVKGQQPKRLTPPIFTTIISF